MDLFFSGFVFGMTLQLGLGPVNILTWIYGLTHGWEKSFKLSLGVALADLIYILISIFFLKKIIEIPILDYMLYIISFGFLLWMGIRAIYSKNKTTNLSNNDLFKGNLIKAGFIINIINPKAIILWVSIFSLLQNPSILFGIGIPFSTIVWLGLVPFLLKILFNKLPQSKQDIFFKKLNKKGCYIIGFVLLFYSFVLLLKIIQMFLEK